MNGADRWEIHTGRQLDRIGVDVTIFRALIGQRKYEVMHANSDGEISVETIDGGSPTKPTLRLDREETLTELIAAFAEKGKALGVRSPDESHNAGKLEATETHLEDMRRLVFEGKRRDLTLPAKKV